MGLGGKEGSFFFKFFSRGESKSWQWRECWNKSPPLRVLILSLGQNHLNRAGGDACAHRPGGPFREEQKGITSHFQFLGAGKLVGTTTFVFPVGLQ